MFFGCLRRLYTYLNREIIIHQTTPILPTLPDTAAVCTISGSSTLTPEFIENAVRSTKTQSHENKENTDFEISNHFSLVRTPEERVVRILDFLRLRPSEEILMDVFKNLNAEEVQEFCAKCAHEYSIKNSFIAGHALLWLIKITCHSHFSIPSLDEFDASTVPKILSSFFSSKTIYTKQPITLINLFFLKYIPHDFLYHRYLYADSYSNFMAYTFEQLQDVKCELWPEKIFVISQLMINSLAREKSLLVTQLMSSQDRKTAEIGFHLLSISTSYTLHLAIPHFNALIDLGFDYIDIERMFNVPFQPMRNQYAISNDSAFAKRLEFNELRQVFLCDDLIIGVLRRRVVWSAGKTIPSYLLAYNKQSEKLIWGIPVTQTPHRIFEMSETEMEAKYYLQKVGEYIILLFKEKREAFFIYSKNGCISFTVTLSYEVEEDNVYFAPCGFGYQVTRKGLLVGGRILDGEWHPSYEMNTPDGFVIPLSTHIGFHNKFEDNQLVIVGPTGAHMIIKNCLSIREYDNNLYLVEEHVDLKHKCILTIRTLTQDESVFSEIEKRIVLDTNEAKIEALCNNKQLILTANSGISLIFVNLNTDEVIYSKFVFPELEKHIINTKLGEIWCWDMLSKEIWKISLYEIIPMGILDSGRGTTLLHVDQDDLYFVDIPF